MLLSIGRIDGSDQSAVEVQGRNMHNASRDEDQTYMGRLISQATTGTLIR